MNTLLIVITAVLVLSIIFHKQLKQGYDKSNVSYLMSYKRKADILHDNIPDNVDEQENLGDLVDFYVLSVNKDAEDKARRSARGLFDVLNNYEAFVDEDPINAIHELNARVPGDLMETFEDEHKFKTFTPNVPIKTIIKIKEPARKRNTTTRTEEYGGNRLFVKNTQNSHDSGVNMSSRASIDRIKKTLGGHLQNTSKVFEDIRRIPGINMNVIERIERNDVPIITFNKMIEADIVATVWSRIHHPDNELRVEDLTDIFKKQINECSSGHGVVCTVGRVNRIMGTLVGSDVDDTLAEAVPMHAIVSSLKLKASDIIEDERVKVEHLFDIVDLTDKQEEELDNSAQTTINRLNDLKATYTSTLSPLKASSIIDPFIDALA